MNKKIILPEIMIMVLAQVYIPARMILDSENILAEGKEFMFKTAPIDPTDPFRGKYIVLTFDESSAQVSHSEEWYDGQPVFVSLTTDEKGFAKIESVLKDEPVDIEDYVNATIRYVAESDSFTNVSLAYPFDRFYMEESKAYDAELAYNEASLDSNQTTYALVSVRKGDAVVKDVLINGVPIREAAMNRRNSE